MQLSYISSNAPYVIVVVVVNVDVVDVVLTVVEVLTVVDVVLNVVDVLVLVDVVLVVELSVVCVAFSAATLPASSTSKISIVVFLIF